MLNIPNDEEIQKSPKLSSNGSRLSASRNGERLLLNQNEDSILSSSSSSSSSFVFEENPSEPRSAELFIIESHTPICVSEFYREHFYEYFHTNYYGEFDCEGPFIASLRCSYQKTNPDVCEARAIIRTQYRNCTVSDIVNENNEHDILQTLFNKINLPLVRSCGTVGDPKANEKIQLFDKTNDERYNCKIGVLYQRVNQTDEYDIFSNDYPSIELLDFLNILGEHIRLKGFQKYRGDLDTKEDFHGEYSYYTAYLNHEIMFNVAPLVPSTKANRQCIERKGLVGNAFVCIVFQDAGAVFSPDFISGKVVQTYITVQPMSHDNELYYKIGIWRRNDITSIIDPPGGTYKNDKSFLPYFLTLILNAVNVAVESPSLRARVYEQRQRMKHEELKKLALLFSIGPIHEFPLDTDNIPHPTEVRSSIRSESSAGNTSITTYESVNSNPVRTSPVLAKKKGLSRKIFGVFSSRSGSFSSSTSANHNNIDAIPISPPTPSTPETAASGPRGSIPSNKENITRQRSIKNNQAPVPPSRSKSSKVPQTVSVQPPTPCLNLLNPFVVDNLTEDNPLNTTALNIIPRNRSNSSPDDTVNTNTSQFYTSKIDEEELTTPSTATSSEEDDDSEDESSEDEKSSNRPFRLA